MRTVQVAEQGGVIEETADEGVPVRNRTAPTGEMPE